MPPTLLLSAFSSFGACCLENKEDQVDTTCASNEGLITQTRPGRYTGMTFPHGINFPRNNWRSYTASGRICF